MLALKFLPKNILLFCEVNRGIQDYNEFVIKNGLTEKSDRFFHDKVLLTPSISKIIEFWFKNFRTNRAFNKSFLNNQLC